MQFNKAAVEWDGWRDGLSGLDSYTYTVYKMTKDAYGQLKEGDVVKDRTPLTVFDAMPDIIVNEPGRDRVELY